MKTYGRQEAESILDPFNTKIFFRYPESSTQTWISKVLGDKEEIEPQENISYGANSMRDGVSLSHHTRQKPLVMPTELSQLEDLELHQTPRSLSLYKIANDLSSIFAFRRAYFSAKTGETNELRRGSGK